MTNLILEQISLVEEEDHGSLSEPARVADLLEQVERLDDAVRVLVLVQHLIVLADGGNEQNGGHVLEAVDPEDKRKSRRKAGDQKLRQMISSADRTNDARVHRKFIRVEVWANLFSFVFVWSKGHGRAAVADSMSVPLAALVPWASASDLAG